MKNLQKTKKNHEKLASALRANLQKRKSRSRFLAENQAAADTEASENSINRNSPAEDADISAN